MTTIFTVSVDAVEGRTLRGRVHIVNPDVPHVPKESVFPLSLLADAWWMLDHGYLRDEDDEDGERSPYTAEQGKDITAGMRLKDEFPDLFELILGKEIRVTEDGYLLADDGRTVLEPRRKAEEVYKLSGGSRPGYSVFTYGDAEEFDQRAAAIVTSYDISPYRNVPLLSEVAAVRDPDEPWDPAKPDGPADLDDYDVWDLFGDHTLAELPYAEIVVTVSDAGYLEHMAAGMRWDTTMTGDVC
ncbi:hypothetical protein [Streptomyces sp. CMB-StM0423]|uniref:hypothetical protein n=1 Tax=Streptomyces sp. CMB-StM0423 TaxID=2059884 RepID=UPI000C7147F4|nr:hypothetical protein [Streptomyces sp. CMB-StM0423]AUH41464.1 hypothetical protein CXR04_15545 [Streptomyces sp. CMB-StM0423]